MVDFEDIKIFLYDTFYVYPTWGLYYIHGLIFNSAYCCECGKFIDYGTDYTKVSTKRYRHTDCFNYYSRSARE